MKRCRTGLPGLVELLQLRTPSCLLLCVLLFAQPGTAADALQLFKNYFITGDYAVGGIGLRGQGVRPSASLQGILGATTQNYATGTIHLSKAVPANSDIVA